MSNVRELLEIFIVTYNRAESLKKTLNSLLNSPVKDFKITILNNNSSDNTEEVVKIFMSKNSNIVYEKNRYNIGGNANIMKAFYKAEKDYVWILADNDDYDWSCWSEVENAIENNYDAIFVSTYRWPEIDIAQAFHQATFLPAVIYKTSNIDDVVMGNMAFNISNLFPHMAVFAKLVNDNKNYFTLSKGIVNIGKNETDHNTRGFNKSGNIHALMKTINWAVGYSNTLYMLSDNKIREYITTHCINCPTICTELVQRGCMKPLYNYFSLFATLPFRQKIKFVINLICRNTIYKFIYIYIDYQRLNPDTYRKIYRIRFFNKFKIKFATKKINRSDYMNK